MVNFVTLLAPEDPGQVNEQAWPPGHEYSHSNVICESPGYGGLNCCCGSTDFCAHDEPVNWHPTSAVPKSSASFENNLADMNFRIRPT
jgi:hypothetical protein